jgi:hypothetical protein
MNSQLRYAAASAHVEELLRVAAQQRPASAERVGSPLRQRLVSWVQRRHSPAYRGPGLAVARPAPHH